MNVDPEIGTVQIALRVTPSLRSRVKAAAERNRRSVNSELIALMEEKYPEPVEEPTADLLARAFARLEHDALKAGDHVSASKAAASARLVSGAEPSDLQALVDAACRQLSPGK